MLFFARVVNTYFISSLNTFKSNVIIPDKFKEI